ncbi:hypothetical protein [Chiayiivirga flava]|uniref:Uncharacterized protein n=1 Tax=Chiayiivirga flava TaxID=659595 RepID=A0A7W8G1M3_9GAMM|nr:hypothetical protein [Chiayiivirga flava]MBB5209018.1 hypothetical protein [Chiayiivirga flava]
MTNRKTVCFTGMEAAEQERLTALFAEANRRLSNQWSLAPENEAQMLVIDVDSLYGHMSWLKVHNSGRTVVAMSSSPQADADHLLSRPVTLDALQALLRQHGGDGDGHAPHAPQPASATPAEDAHAARPDPGAQVRAVSAEQKAVPRRVSAEQPAVPPRRVSAEQQAVPAGGPPRSATTDAARRTPPPAVAATSTSAPAAAVAAPAPEPRLADYLQPGALPGPVKLARGDAPLLVLDPAARVYFGGSGLKDYLPYTREPIAPGAWTVVPASELAKLRQELGGAQPFARLLWLAALTGGGGELAPGLDPNARYRLTKWPQIEREFAKHFRIATTMMKGLLSVAEIAQQSGASTQDVADFINASLATGFAESDAIPEGGDAAAVVRGGLFGRLRGGR